MRVHVRERADEITLCVSELATNALLHGVPPGRGFLLCLNREGGVLRVELHDSGGGWPLLGVDVDGAGVPLGEIRCGAASTVSQRYRM